MSAVISSAFTAVSAAVCASALHEWTADDVQTQTGTGCVAPGVCTPPKTSFERVAIGPKPGQQWNINGGFCGAWSTQQTSLSAGAYISQDLVRKANRFDAGAHYMHGNHIEGFEVMPSNVATTLENLRIKHEVWDYNQASPQAPAFKRWLKSHLVSGSPIIFFPMCKGDGHMPYKDSCPNGGHVDHVEPMFGIYSNHPDDADVWDDDVIVHASDQDGNPYYRPLNSLDDTPEMQGNCKEAQPGFGKNEMYPCFDREVSYGAAVLGLDIQEGVHKMLPVHVEIPDLYAEPNVRVGQKPILLRSKVTIESVTPGRDHTLFVFNRTSLLPQTTDSLAHTAELIMPFKSDTDVWTWEDPTSFASNTARYYVAV